MPQINQKLPMRFPGKTMSSDPKYNLDLADLPSPISKHPRNWSSRFIWIIPILALLIGISLGIKVMLDRGPTITISFKSGEGLEAGKTHVKYKDVIIGVVKTVDLSEDHKQVIATIQIDRKASDFLREDTHFWIVRPRITASGVSGLSTLFGGTYIAADLGQSHEIKDAFVALEVPPILTRDTPGRKFTLRAPNLGSHDIGTPVYFRRLTVGEVVAYELDKDGKGVSIEVFIHAPYDQYVQNNTRFWNASGVDVSVGATGVKVQTESLISVLAGGIAFEGPPMAEDGSGNPMSDYQKIPADAIATNGPNDRAAQDTAFPLYATRELAMQHTDMRVEQYVINFKQSVRGLAIGAPIDFRGVNIGEVISVDTSIDPKDFSIVQPVGVKVYPDRLRLRSTSNGAPYPAPKNNEERAKRFQAMIDRGLRAQLRTGNMLTGQQYVALDFFPDAPKYTLDSKKVPLQLPSIPGSFDDIEKSVSGIVKKLDNETLPELNKTLKNADALLASDSPLQTDLRETLRELSKAASAMKRLADTL
ncbi:MAG: intermembrane transport protein PqiB, partial [Fluviibacter sp.]